MIQGHSLQGAIYDYCRHLGDALQAQGITTHIAPLRAQSGSLWSYFSQLYRFIRTYRKQDCIFHLHYPGWPLLLELILLPQLILLALPAGRTVTTIHDMTKFPKVLHLPFFPFLKRSRALIFTTAAECDAAQSLMRLFGIDIRHKSHIIPVGSGIGKADAIPPYEAREGVAYFGHLRSGKGLEFFLDTAGKMHLQGSRYPFYIIGNIDSCDFLRYRYATAIVARVYRLSYAMKKQLRACTTSAAFRAAVGSLDPATKILPHVHFVLDADERTCAVKIASCRFALMYFADGASMRRTSLQAVLLNQCITLTRWSQQTEASLKAVTLAVATPEEACRIIQGSDDFVSLQQRMQTYDAQISWQSIAQRHSQVFAEVAALA